jgi:hypothetical protein
MIMMMEISEMRLLRMPLLLEVRWKSYAASSSFLNFNQIFILYFTHSVIIQYLHSGQIFAQVTGDLSLSLYVNFKEIG